MVKFNINSNLKIFYLPNNKFIPIPNFQVKSPFPNIAQSILISTLLSVKCAKVLPYIHRDFHFLHKLISQIGARDCLFKRRIRYIG